MESTSTFFIIIRDDHDDEENAPTLEPEYFGTWSDEEEATDALKVWFDGTKWKTEGYTLEALLPTYFNILDPDGITSRDSFSIVPLNIFCKANVGDLI